jgi:predicted permease
MLDGDWSSDVCSSDLVLPLLAIALVQMVGLPAAQQTVVVAFASLPTASSAYVLATRMGGHGAFVAGLVSMSTLIGMLGVPLALALLAAAQAGP